MGHMVIDDEGRNGPQQSAGQTEQNPQYKYRPEDIDWNSLTRRGK